MKIENFEFKGKNGVTLPAMLWLPEDTPKLILQVTHGMTEHMERYSSLAAVLTTQGIAVAGFDLRGHGKNSGDSGIASFGENGWEAVLEDMHLFFGELEEHFCTVPHVMLGFSLGSFLLREYLGRYPERVAGAIIMGTGYQPGLVLSVMMAVVKSQMKKAGIDGVTNLIKKLSFGVYNEKFKPNRTDFDWICSDKMQLEAYLADPLRRENISTGLFWQMLGAMKRTCGRNAYDGWQKKMPVLLLSGEDDPVGSAGKGVQRVQEHMKKSGMCHVTMELFPAARHDILHEEASGAAEKAREKILCWLLELIQNYKMGRNR